MSEERSVEDLRRHAEKELGVPSSLHEYQWDGVAFLYRSRSALLADEMGLGKTVQASVALALLLHSRIGVRRAVIVAPSSLTLNWTRELAKWAPSLTVRRVSGDARAREAYYLLPIPVLVASYEQIRFDSLDRVPPDTFDLVVLDEAQRIKNRDSATAFACRLLPRSRAWALSATPLENEEADLASILSFLRPSLNLRGSQLKLRTELKHMMLRRRKSEVRAELPPVLVQDLDLELSSTQRSTYDEIWLDRAATVRAGTKGDPSSALLALITRLKIVCNFDSESDASSKLDALRWIAEGAGEGARILVFSQFVETLKWISERLDLSHELLVGSMSVEARQKVIDRFSGHSTPRALLISLRAGGVGLNLGEATHVVLFDRWWNPAVEIQAIYRAHRFERSEPLHVIRFLASDTIEERIAEILARKADLFDEVVESAESQVHRFTREELLEILDLASTDINLNAGEISRL
jgi:SNF2 family DNA or RNA helicase